MREKFSEFFPPEGDEFDKLWEEAHFVFDANTLLNLYMYSQDTVDDYWKVLNCIEDRIWIPYQVGYEFNKNRPSRIRDQQVLFEKTIESLKSISKQAEESIEDTFNNTREHPSIEETEIKQKVDEFFSQLIGEIEKKQEEHPDLLREKDNIRTKISKFFKDKIGDKLSEDELQEIFNKGEKRYKEKTPPGWKDKNEKEGDAKYGDLMIWEEIIRYSESQDSVNSVIFVTNDSKEDWWHKSSGQTIGPHYKLIKEFNQRTGKDYYQYKPDQFLRYAKENLIDDISDDSISETKRVSDQTYLASTGKPMLDQLIQNYSFPTSVQKQIENLTKLPSSTREQLEKIAQLPPSVREALRAGEELNSISNLPNFALSPSVKEVLRTQEAIHSVDDILQKYSSLSPSAREILKNYPVESKSDEEE